MKIYKIPELYCPFPSEIHPNMAEIEAHTNQWVQDFDLISSEEMFQKYRSQKFSNMIARSYPYGDFEDLAAWCNVNTLLFIVDDNFDEGNEIRDIASFTYFVDGLLDVLERGRRCTVKKDGPILAALDDFWQSMQFRSSDIWKQKFIQGIKDTFEGGLWQFKHAIKSELPNLNEYFAMRQYLGAANLATESLEVTGKVQLSEPIYKSPVVHKLTEIARNTVCFANDLFSLSKEIARGSGNASEFNLVSILKRKDQLSTEDAIKDVAAIHDNEIRKFIQLAERALVYDSRTNEQLSRYISCLQHFMKGNIVWSTTESSRYPHVYG
ncbi:terpene synthase family protein [Dinghuibacter silviterrae]|uniref:Terpene synthase n=1 Tax=Dinghuibacter silviterrae TaxID=1539049 RepID=A0A4R8DHZ9_9BACT|nr:hypothetical protein [Dinghuibacter silviterrae]TDW96904.1 hypothetical protein EDB95_4740 [Dinghuibacter silviterrae]